MTISDRGLRMLQNFEGCRLTAYKDAVGVTTIGFGSTGPHVKMGMTITQAQADALLKQDLVRFEDAVNLLVTTDLTQPQFDALVSLAFNIGIGGFASSTVLRKLNAGDDDGAAEAFGMWVHGTKNGQKIKLPGLVKRRAAEAKRFREAE